jgi:hypothetical protein
MSYEVNEKELASVLALSADRRYGYFLNRAVDWEELWSLGDEYGWALCSGADGSELIPVWPARAYAEACAGGAWAGFVPRAIPLADWLEKWTPGMISDQRLVAMFPTPDNTGAVIDPIRLAEDMQEMLKQSE